MLTSTETPKVPVLIFLLEQHKFQQIIKAMLNPNVSKTMLQQMGYPLEKFSDYEERKIRNSCKHFTIKEILEIRGSHKQKPREYQDNFLKQILKRKIRQEIPTNLERKKMWVQFTEIHAKIDYYENLQDLELATEFKVSIRKDILRTEVPQELRLKTQNVLACYAKSNPYLGYTQGMNFIIAFLLKEGFGEEEAFFVFKRLAEDILPPDFYTNMDGIMADMRIFFEILSFTHPKCYSKMKEISQSMESNFITTVSFVFQWFVCLYTNDCLPAQITEIIWDHLLIEGKTVLFRAAIVLFDFFEPFILQCKDYQSYMKIEKQIPKSITNIEHFRRRLQEISISEQILFLLKEKITEQAKNKMDEQNPKKEQKEYKISKKCNLEWNACTHALQKNSMDLNFYQFFVFKPKEEIKLIPDYLQKINKHYFNSVEKGAIKNKSQDILIGRIEHICRPESETITDDSCQTEKKERNINSPETHTTNESGFIQHSQNRIRQRAAERLNEVAERKPGMERSESFIFMQTMVQNASISALMQYYDIDEMFQN